LKYIILIFVKFSEFVGYLHPTLVTRRIYPTWKHFCYVGDQTCEKSQWSDIWEITSFPYYNGQNPERYRRIWSWH